MLVFSGDLSVDPRHVGTSHRSFARFGECGRPYLGVACAPTADPHLLEAKPEELVARIQNLLAPTDPARLNWASVPQRQARAVGLCPVREDLMSQVSVPAPAPAPARGRCLWPLAGTALRATPLLTESAAAARARPENCKTSPDAPPPAHVVHCSAGV